MPDPQQDNPVDYQPLEGTVISRNDPRGLKRVLVEVPGFWDQGNWCFVFGGRWGTTKDKGDTSIPPIGADVLVFFAGGNSEKPYCTPVHFGIDEAPSEATVATDTEAAAGEGDNKVWQDERIRVEVDARAGSYSIRISDLANGVDNIVDIDPHSGQLGVYAPLGILLKSDAHVRIESPLVTINGRVVKKKGRPI
jgi:hypothetical protein